VASIEIGNMPCRTRTAGIILSMMVAPIAVSTDRSKSDLKGFANDVYLDLGFSGHSQDGRSSPRVWKPENS
jgi:hypothetical protein